MTDVKMDEVNKFKVPLNWDPRDSYKINENDIYLAVIATMTKSKYIITYDKAFIEAYSKTFPDKTGVACDPGKFISLESFI